MAEISSKETQVYVLLNSVEQILTKRPEICHSINLYAENVVVRHYKNTLKLITEAIPLLALLGKLTGFSKIRYQTISDKVAYPIYVCSCTLF